MTGCPYGFRVVGPTWEARRLVDAAAALSAHCSCDPRCQLDRECYLSAFQYGNDFRHHLETTGSTADFVGECWAAYLWFDIDRDDVDIALTDARRLAVTIDERYRLPDGDLLAFYSGSKGFHLGLPTSLWQPKPAVTFHKVARRFAERLAELAGVTIDTGVYDKVRLFRAPNSRHPKTGLHKRQLPLDVLMQVSLDGIKAMAAEPAPFDLPEPPATNDQAIADWLDAQAHVERQGESERRSTCRVPARRELAYVEPLDAGHYPRWRRARYRRPTPLVVFGRRESWRVWLPVDAGQSVAD